MDFHKSHAAVPSAHPLNYARIHYDYTTNYHPAFARCSEENRYRPLHCLRLDEPEISPLRSNIPQTGQTGPKICRLARV